MPWRRVVIGLVTTVLLVVAGLAVAEASADRAVAAENRSATLAAQSRSAAGVRAATRAETNQVLAERRAHARTAEVAQRTAAVQHLAAKIAAADKVLAASEHKVTDDAVRHGLTGAIDAARSALDVGPPGAPLADLAASGKTADAARLAVEAASATWQHADTAAKAAAAKAAAAQVAAAKASADAAAPAPAPPPAPAPTAGVPVWITSVPTADGDGSNGHLPASAMCLVPWGTDQIGSPQYLRCDATEALTRLNDAFRAKFGASLAMDLTYRSFDEQVRIKAYYGGSAATPGTSNHGLGLALDVQEWPDTYGFGTPRYDWLVANGPTFGWVAPASVAQGAAYPEYWHFEYRP